MSTKMLHPGRLRPSSSSVPVARRIAGVQATVERVVALVLGRSHPEHEDIVQNCLERLLGLLADDASRSIRACDHLAAVVARNVAVDALRTLRRQGALILSLHDHSTRYAPWRVDPERVAIARELLAQWARDVSRLGKTYADVIFLHDALGHDLCEVADALGLSPSAAQSRFIRGRARLHRVMLKRLSQEPFSSAS